MATPGKIWGEKTLPDSSPCGVSSLFMSSVTKNASLISSGDPTIIQQKGGQTCPAPVSHRNNRSLRMWPAINNTISCWVVAHGGKTTSWFHRCSGSGGKARCWSYFGSVSLITDWHWNTECIFCVFLFKKELRWLHTSPVEVKKKIRARYSQD